VSRRSLTVAVEHWPLNRPFTIARGTKTEAVVVVATITDPPSGARGRGECVPYPRYGESADGVAAMIEASAPAIEAGADREEVGRLLPAGAARNAIDCALWDLEAKLCGRSAAALAGLPVLDAVITAETIAIDTPAAMAAAAALVADRPLLKVKVGGDGVLERVTAVRAAAPRSRLVVDANEGWSAPLLMALMDPLAALGVEMIEQPLPADGDAAIAGLRPPLVLCADESCHGAGDVAGLADRYQAINVKLDKAGGLTEAMRTVEAARRQGLGLMVGCMVATSLAIAPALLLAATADVVDLDGPLWLARDRSPGLAFDRGWIRPAGPALWG
jgi:L-alanine-DL-glutamate epimerase-like enolase superfamily enzyme